MKRTIKIFFVGLLYFICQLQLPAQITSPKGLWKFDDTENLTKATIGNDLQLNGYQQAVQGPNDGNGAVRIGKGSFYRMQHGILPNGGGTMVNEYTIQFDFKISALNDWHCFLQTNPANATDGDFFIDKNGYFGVQAASYSSYTLKPNLWYRLVISVKNGSWFNFYLDGLQTLGIPQQVDGRFALDSSLLLFADDNGEDAEIDCAEIAIWDYALSKSEVQALGNYGNSPKQLILIPYLQAPSHNSIYICWYDSLNTTTRVEYGTTFLLGQIAEGTSEIISDVYRWHTVKLTSLQPNTEYFYRAISGSGSSKVYSFKTQPDKNYNGKIRFLLLSDTHSNDTTTTMKVLKSAKKKLHELYGDEYYKEVNLILQSGDQVIDGYDIVEWTEQYFAPMSVFSFNIPVMTVTGNHELESSFYYSYMKYEDVSGFPTTSELNERFWSMQIANTMVLGINSNIASRGGTEQLEWLKSKLNQSESDSTIDFVFVITHHLPISELWGEGILDIGAGYVRNSIIPILKKYSKVVQLSYGHTHGFERGTIESDAANSFGDFRFVCGGGGGGKLDRWGYYTNKDYSSIHISLDQYSYQIIEIDAANKTFESSLYSLGNESKSRDSELMDHWYRKINQPAPLAPKVYAPSLSNNRIIFNTSKINSDSLMTVRIKVSEYSDFRTTVADTMIHWKNIFGVDSNFDPVDLNNGLNLTKVTLSTFNFLNDKTYYYKVRYRDHNLRWSNWSNTVPFMVPANAADSTLLTDYDLKQNFPNPFNSETKIIYQIPNSGFTTLKVYDILGHEVAFLVNEEKKAGRYEAVFNGAKLSSGVYFYKIQTGRFTQTKKLILIK